MFVDMYLVRLNTYLHMFVGIFCLLSRCNCVNSAVGQAKYDRGSGQAKHGPAEPNYP